MNTQAEAGDRGGSLEVWSEFTQDCRSLTKGDIKSGGQLATTGKVLILVGLSAQTMFVHVWYTTSGRVRS